MRRRDVLRAAVTPLTIPWLARADASAGANPAKLYREAVRAFPRWKGDDAGILRSSATTPLDEATARIVAESAQAIEIATRAASAPACDWGDAWTGPNWYEDGTSLGMDLSQLARVVALKGRFARRDGHPRAGLDACLTAIRIGRHLAQGRTKIAQVIGFAVEHVAIEVGAACLSDVDRRGQIEVGERFRAMPATVSLADVIRAEKAWFFNGYLPTHRDEFPAAKLDHYRSEFDRSASASETPAGLAALLAEKPVDDEAKEAREKFKAFLKSRKYVDVKRALFLSAVEVATDGPAGVARVVDPTDGRPFDFRSWATGFELASRFALEGKPRASLVVGRR